MDYEGVSLFRNSCLFNAPLLHSPLIFIIYSEVV